MSPEEEFKTRNKDEYETALANNAYAIAAPRLEKPSLRTRTSTLSVDFLKRLCVGKYRNTFKGLPLMKDAISLHLYTVLLERLRPRTIFDLGTAGGGSGLWFASQVCALGLSPDTEVVSFDVDDLRTEDAKKQFDETPNLHFVPGNMFRAEEAVKTAAADAGLKLEHPWLIAEDCHVVASILLKGFMNAGLSKGDYVVFEDTHPEGPDTMHMHAESELRYTCDSFGIEKLRRVEKAIHELGGDQVFAIDTSIQDMYGYNGATHINSVFTFI